MSLETGQILQDIGLSATISQLWGKIGSLAAIPSPRVEQMVGAEAIAAVHGERRAAQMSQGDTTLIEALEQKVGVAHALNDGGGYS